MRAARAARRSRKGTSMSSRPPLLPVPPPRTLLADLSSPPRTETTGLCKQTTSAVGSATMPSGSSSVKSTVSGPAATRPRTRRRALLPSCWADDADTPAILAAASPASGGATAANKRRAPRSSVTSPSRAKNSIIAAYLAPPPPPPATAVVEAAWEPTPYRARALLNGEHGALLNRSEHRRTWRACRSRRERALCAGIPGTGTPVARSLPPDDPSHSCSRRNVCSDRSQGGGRFRAREACSCERVTASQPRPFLRPWPRPSPQCRRRRSDSCHCACAWVGAIVQWRVGGA
jgi:hypothetical protein